MNSDFFRVAGEDLGSNRIVGVDDLELYDILSDVIVMKYRRTNIGKKRISQSYMSGFATVRRQATGKIFDAIILNAYFGFDREYVSEGMLIIAEINQDPDDRLVRVIAPLRVGERINPDLAKRIVEASKLIG